MQFSHLEAQEEQRAWNLFLKQDVGQVEDNFVDAAMEVEAAAAGC